MNNHIDRQILLADETYKKQENFWHGLLTGDATTTLLPVEEANAPGSVKTMELDVDPFLSSRLLRLSKGGDLSLYIMTLAGLAVTLCRYTGQRRPVILSPIYRPAKGRHTLNDRVVVVAEVDERSSFAELVKGLLGVVIDSYGNQDYPYEELARRLALPPRLTDVACSMAEIHQTLTAENEPAFHLVLGRDDNRLTLSVRFASIYPELWIRRFAGHTLTILQHCAEDPHRQLSSIPMLSPQEEAILLQSFNHTQPPVSQEATVPAQIRRITVQCPDRAALSSDEGEISYGWLDRASDALAGRLKQLGMGTDRLAALLMPRSPLMAVVILGVWKAGGAYIPLRFEDPPQRVAGILADACPTAVFTCAPGAPHTGLVGFDGPVVDVSGIFIHNMPECERVDAIGSSPEALAYVIYTSGSTGRPKGAMVEHKGMLNHIDAKIADLGVTPQSIIAQNASHTFDISVWQFFTALAVGGKTIVYKNETILDAARFLELVTAHCLTILEVVPSYLSVLLEVAGPAMVESLARSLKLLLVTGETVKPELINQWFETFPRIPVMNAYGPTEASDDICHHLMKGPERGERVPVGRPLRNLIVTVLGARHCLLPQGVKGEICVSGVGVGRGYLNDPEKTATAFVANPFSEDPRARMYKTGDVGRFMPDGVVDFFGRQDQQVKIRGFRIELEEIERHISRHPAVKKNIVVDVADDAGNTFLCAFIQTLPDTGVAPVKEHVAAHVPDYMVPARFEQIDTFPLTANGKIDRKRLRAMALESGDTIPFLSSQSLQEVLARRRKNPLDEIAEELDNEAIVIQRHAGATNRALFPLSQIQKTIYNTEKVFPGTTAEVNCGVVIYPRLLNRELLKESIRETIRRQPGLRLRLVEIENSGQTIPAQYIHGPEDVDIEHLDFSDDADGTRLNRWIDGQRNLPFGLVDRRLYFFAILTLSDGRSGYFIKSHHLVSDGWSYSLMLSGIDAVYAGLESGNPQTAPAVTAYDRYVDDELDYLHSPKAAGHLEYWLESLAHTSVIRPWEPKYPVEGIGIRHFSRLLAEDIAQLVSDFTTERNTTQYMVVLAALALCLAQWNQSPDMVIGSVSHGRYRKDLKPMVGVTINSMPLAIRVDPARSFRQLATGDCYGLLFKALRHQRFPFSLMGSRLRSRHGVDPRHLLQVNLVDHPSVATENFDSIRLFPTQDPIPLSIHINPSKNRSCGGLELAYLAQERFFRQKDIDRLHQSVAAILRSVLQEPERPLADIIRDLPPDGSEIERRLLRLERVEKALVSPPFVFIETTGAVTEAECVAALPPADRSRDFRFVAVAEIPAVIPTTLELDALLSQGANRPTDPQQIQLAALWAEVLAIDESILTPQSDFFQCGGQSLKATVLNSKIQRQFQVNIPLARLFDTPVLADMADLIKQAGDRASRAVPGNLVPLKKGSASHRYLFLVHAGSGEVEHYLELAKQLDPSFYVWGLRADPIHNLTPENRTIRQLAETYLGQIKKLCPHGPYYLGGLCIGGVIAYEMVRLLEERGEEARLLVFVDSALFPLETVPFTFQSELDWVKRHFFNKQILEDLDGSTELKQIWPRILDALVKLDVAPDTIRGGFPQGVGLATPDFENLDLEGLIYYNNLGRTFHNAVASYIPPAAIKTPIHSFIATQSLHREVYRLSWGDYAAGGIEFEDVAGGHFTVFAAPYVDSLARKFNAALQKAANRDA